MNAPSRISVYGRHRRFLFRMTIVIALLLACTVALLIFEQRRAQSETGAILTAFFSDEVLHGNEDRGAGGEIQIVLLREAQNPRERGPMQRSPLFDPQSVFSQSSRTTQASFFLSNVFSTDIHAGLQLPGRAQFFLISRKEVAGTNGKNFEARFPHNFGYFVISLPGLNLGKTEAILYVDHFCGGLCGGGGYFLMRKVSGIWHVVDQHITWTS